MDNKTPDSNVNLAAAPSLEQSVVKRVLACYLPVERPEPGSPRQSAEYLSLEATLTHALDFLRCASATSYELSDQLGGARRDLALSSMHMVEMAKVMIERSLECVEQR